MPEAGEPRVIDTEVVREAPRAVEAPRWKRIAKKLGLYIGIPIAGAGLLSMCSYYVGRYHESKADKAAIHTDSAPARLYEQMSSASQMPSGRHPPVHSTQHISLYVKGLEGRADFNIEGYDESMRDHYLSLFQENGKSNEEIFDIFCLADSMDGKEDYTIDLRNLDRFVAEEKGRIKYDSKKLRQKYSGGFTFLKGQ